MKKREREKKKLSEPIISVFPYRIAISIYFFLPDECLIG